APSLQRRLCRFTHFGLLSLNRAVAGSGLREMARSRERSFCCGGGGGRAWIEETIGTRINQVRTGEALETGAGVVGTACPYCLQMFEDGIKGVGAEEKIKSLDLAELVDRAIQGEKAEVGKAAEAPLK
ncbi:MAG: (Fe-S)-binding protein, partial [Actinobacteria bacterium]|nr:(Fe-S)-binding protein [Actinomycetota bacterium]